MATPIICKGCGQKHDPMLVRCPTVIATAPYGGKVVDVIIEEAIPKPTRKLKVPMTETKEVRVQAARDAVEPPKCNDPNCGYRKAYEARKAKESAKVKRWREKRHGEVLK